MPKLSDLLVPAPLRKTPKPGEAGVPKTPATQNLKDSPPEQQTDSDALPRLAGLELSTSYLPNSQRAAIV